MQHPILFVDIEATGLDPKTTKIIEAAFKLYYLEEHEGLKCFGSCHGCFKTTPEDWEGVHPKVTEMHEANGLKEMSLNWDYLPEDQRWTDLSPVIDLLNNFAIQKPWLACEKDHVGLISSRKIKPYLGGNSVHFDRSHLEYHFPLEMKDYVHYRNFDVTSIATFMQILGVPLYQKEKAHTARADLLETLGELTYLAQIASCGMVSWKGVSEVWEKLKSADVMADAVRVDE